MRSPLLPKQTRTSLVVTLKGLSASGSKSNSLKNYRLSTSWCLFEVFFEMFFSFFDNLLFPNLRVSAVSAEFKIAGIGRSGPVPAPEMWKSECSVLEARRFWSNSKFLAFDITFQAWNLFLIVLFILKFWSVLWFLPVFWTCYLWALHDVEQMALVWGEQVTRVTPEAYSWKGHPNWSADSWKLSHAIKPMWYTQV